MPSAQVVFHDWQGPLFGGIIDDLTAAVRELSESGARRLVTVAARCRLLDSGATWQLLEAGATAVLAWDDSPDPVRQVSARRLASRS